MKILTSDPVSLARVKEILEKRQKDSELGHEQQMTLENVEKFAKYTPKKSEDLENKIIENEKIPLTTAIKIVDLAPTTPDLVKNLLLLDKVDLTDDEIPAIIKLFEK